MRRKHAEQPVSGHAEQLRRQLFPGQPGPCSEAEVAKLNTIKDDVTYRVTMHLRPFPPCDADNTCYSWMGDVQIKVT